MKRYNKEFKRLAFQIHRYTTAHLICREYSKLSAFLFKKPKSMMLGYPYHILIEPTLKCNINCPMCPTPQRLNPRRKLYNTMSFDIFKSVIANCKDIAYRIHLTYSGEPLLNPDLHLMISHLTELGIMSMITTNATLMNKKRAEQLIGAGLDYLIVSFDGFSPGSYESFRVGANFEKTLENLKLLSRVKRQRRAHKPYIDIQWIRNKLNESEIDSAEKYFFHLKGINEFHVKSLSLNDHHMTEGEIRKYGEKFLPRKGKIRNQYKKRRDSNPSGQKCPFIFSPVILANGDVTVCCIDYKGEYVVGNVLDEKFRHLWNSKNYISLRREAENYKLPICLRCPIRFN